jgi:hypothetical protein
VAKRTEDATGKWDRALEDARNPATAVSLLDTMDQTVERLLYHQGEEASVSVSDRR